MHSCLVFDLQDLKMKLVQEEGQQGQHIIVQHCTELCDATNPFCLWPLLRIVQMCIMVTPQSILSVGLKYQNKHCFTTACNQGDALSSQVSRNSTLYWFMSWHTHTMNSNRVCDCLLSVRAAITATYAWIKLHTRVTSCISAGYEHSLSMALTWSDLSHRAYCLWVVAAKFVCHG